LGKTNKGMLAFLTITFLISWGSWGIIIVFNNHFDSLWYGTPLFYIPYLIGAISPALSVIILLGKKAFTHAFIFGHFKDRRNLLFFFMFGIWRLFMIHLAFGIENWDSMIWVFISFPLYLVGGGLEEWGWRNYLQPKLETKTSVLISVISVGIIWSVWHLPLWLIAGTIHTRLSFCLYLIVGVVLSFSFTTLQKVTNSNFLCVLSHAWFNGCLGMAVYIGADGFINLHVSWVSFAMFFIELVLSAILLSIYQRKKPKSTVFSSRN